MVLYGVCIFLVVVVLLVFGWMYHSQKEAAMSEVCKANMHSLLFTLRSYADAHGGKLPSSAGEHWVRGSSNYLTNSAVLKCPMDKGKNETSYLLATEAAGKLVDLLRHKVILIENSPRHHGAAHAVLGDGTVIDVKGGFADAAGTTP